MHLDFVVEDLDTAVRRAERAGARRGVNVASGAGHAASAFPTLSDMASA
ncbi:VOC family protein [Halomonas caseinilytica]